MVRPPPAADVTNSGGMPVAGVHDPKIQFGSFSPVDHTDRLPSLDVICLGSFKLPIPSEITDAKDHIFCGSKWNTAVWNNIPDETLYHIMDLRQAEYTDQIIASICHVHSVPPEQFILSWLGRCNRCFAIGHKSSDCTAQYCTTCNLFLRACICGPQLCNNPDHSSIFCPARLLCDRCKFLGHLGRRCGLAVNGPCKFIWKPKILPSLPKTRQPHHIYRETKRKTRPRHK